MKSYTALRNLYGVWTNNTTTANLTNGDGYINDSLRTIYNLRGGKWKFLEDTIEVETREEQRSYEIPNKFRKVMDVYVTVGDTVYMPEPVFDPNKWKLILAYRMGISDIPMFYYVENQKIHFAPVPATDGNIVTVRGRLQPSDLNIADYTTGTIQSIPYPKELTANVAVGATSATFLVAWGLPSGEYRMLFNTGEVRTVTLTNASTAVTWTDALTELASPDTHVNSSSDGTIVTGNGTTWTEDMVGRYIRITQTTAANGGDGQWYEIGEWYDSTHIALVKTYTGTFIDSGTAAYTIGQMSLLPEAYDTAPIYRAVAQYWDGAGETDRAMGYWMKYDGGYEMGRTKVYGGLIGQMLENEGESIEGTYIPPFGSTSNIVNTGAWFSPWQSDASGGDF